MTTIKSLLTRAGYNENRITINTFRKVDITLFEFTLIEA